MQGTSDKKKVTFSLSEDVVLEMKKLIERKQSGSQNKFVEEALREYIRRMRLEMLRREMVEASRDPLFLEDIRQAEKDFSRVDAEVLESAS